MINTLHYSDTRSNNGCFSSWLALLGTRKLALKNLRNDFFPVYVIFFKGSCTLLLCFYILINLKRSYIVCIPSLFSGGVESPTKFSKRGGVTRPQLLEGVTRKKGSDFFQRGCSCHIKNKLTSEIFNHEKSLSTKIFLSVITKNSNLEILHKNFLTF